MGYVGARKHRQNAGKGTGTVETRWLKMDGGVIDPAREKIALWKLLFPE
ncbi:MAG: hypothetical protein MUC76_03870 [Spirochaetes bacterium]|nr:hypothetical protein [Spirochaetota bacterium]